VIAHTGLHIALIAGIQATQQRAERGPSGNVIDWDRNRGEEMEERGRRDVRTSTAEAGHGGAAVGEDDVVDDDGERDHLQSILLAAAPRHRHGHNCKQFWESVVPTLSSSSSSSSFPWNGIPPMG
jgi:hypothetical protein